MGANGASGQELQIYIAPKNRFHTNFLDRGRLYYFLEKIMDLFITSYFHPRNLPVLLEMYWVYYSYYPITTDSTYNFKDLAVGSLVWSSKTGVNSSYFPQQISTCHVLCCILKLSASRVAWAYLHVGASVNKKKYIFLVDLVAHFLKLYVGCMRKWSVAMKIAASEIGF